jgi:hypothetical protein
MRDYNNTFTELKNSLSKQLEKKATWKQVADHYNIPFFKHLNTKQISMRVSLYKVQGLPAKVKLWILENNY